MAAVIFNDPTEGVDESSSFKYNKKYEIEDGNFVEDADTKTTGQGDNAYIYNQHKEAFEFRDDDVDNLGVGSLWSSSGANARNSSINGDATLAENFVYNGGTTSSTNEPTYFDKESDGYTDASRGEQPYNIGGKYNVNTFRNETE